MNFLTHPGGQKAEARDGCCVTCSERFIPFTVCK